ncbi:hypothetical protein F5Y16DRAFT_382690 [Xylariaceae sp. FL0255]|nr:hypothetical protein F5Y16DRAFT_382690 [Xylariaceae sp. FL0255]
MLPSSSSGPFITSTDRAAASTADQAFPHHPASSAPERGPPAESPYKRHPSASLSAHSPESIADSSHFTPRANVVVPEDQRTKKRRTGTGSRGVANLTPEQLAKKRANDREAQRAIRERTKNQIEALEARISELTSQQPYQELQKVIRQKEAVEAENEEIKARLASIISMLNPYLSSQQATARANLTSPSSSYTPLEQPAPAHPPPSSYSAYNALTPGSTASPASGTDLSWHGHPIPLLKSDKEPQAQTQLQQDSLRSLDRGRNFDMGGDHLELGPLLDPSQNIKRVQVGPNGAQDSPSYQHMPMKHWSSPDGKSASYANADEPHPRHDVIEPYIGAVWGFKGPFLHLEPSCPLDQLILDFLYERRQRAIEGVSAQEIVGPRYPSVSSLLNPQNSIYSHPVSRVFTDILATFPDIYRLPEKVAMLYIMFLITRWMISPTQENRDLLPSLAQPVAEQFSTPHPAWMDHLPFPLMRSRIIQKWSHSPIVFTEFFIHYNKSLSLNWPYEECDVLLRSADGNEVFINPVFERHLFTQENWTLGESFDRAFPYLRGTYPLKSDSSTPGSHAGST